MIPESSAKLRVMRKGGQELAKVIQAVARLAKPGASLLDLDRQAELLIKKTEGTPAFKGYRGYPFATCLSVNTEIVHGTPRAYHLKQGDLIGIDIGLLYRGFYLDSALTVPIGKVSSEDKKLLRVTYEALWEGIRLVRPGVRLGDIQAAIQHRIEEQGLTIVRDLCGHGIGKNLQEEPQIPNFGKAGTGPILKEGQTFALEPMVSFRSAHTTVKADGWTVVTLGGDKAAHFEHTVAVTKTGALVLTKRSGEKEPVSKLRESVFSR